MVKDFLFRHHYSNNTLQKTTTVTKIVALLNKWCKMVFSYDTETTLTVVLAVNTAFFKTETFL